MSIEGRLSRLEAENRELRRLWIETEGDVIELRTYLDRKLRELDANEEDRKVKGLAKLIMYVHRKSGGTIRERSPTQQPSNKATEPGVSNEQAKQVQSAMA